MLCLEIHTLPIYTEGYLIKGEIPFRIKFTENYSNNQPDEKYSIGIQVNKNDLSKEIAREYLKFMATLIRKYSNNAINFICCDGFNKAHNFSNCPLAYIGENGFFKNHTTKDKAYYEFFERLCDNNWRNIVYIGETVKQNAPLKEIAQVENEMIPFHLKSIAETLGIST